MSRRRRRSSNSPKLLDPEPEPEPEPEPLEDAEILTFTFGISGEIIDIDDEDNEVVAILPNGTDISELTATFTLSEGATSNPSSPINDGDFSSSVQIVVTAEDESQRTWTVFTSVADPL